MMAAAQPFISGAISKTVNLPPDATVEDMQDAYMEAWKQGLKAVAVYRDGCKRTQPLSTSKTDPGLGKTGRGRGRAGQERPARGGAPEAARRAAVAHAQVLHRRSRGLHPRRPVRDRRAGRDLREDGQGGLDHLGPDGQLRDRDLAGLQHGVPLRLLCDKFSRTRFEPYGFTENPEIPRASSIMDYLFRWLGSKFVTRRDAGRGGSPRPRRPADARSRRVGRGGRRRRRRSRSSTCRQAAKANGRTATERPRQRQRCRRTPATATTASSPAPTRPPAPNADRS